MAVAVVFACAAVLTMTIGAVAARRDAARWADQVGVERDAAHRGGAALRRRNGDARSRSRRRAVRVETMRAQVRRRVLLLRAALVLTLVAVGLALLALLMAFLAESFDHPYPPGVLGLAVLGGRWLRRPSPSIAGPRRRKPR